MGPWTRGNSFANGQDGSSGPLAVYGWRSGYQAPRPVTHWDFTEPGPVV